MLAYTYLANGDLRLLEKPCPDVQSPTDAVVEITLASVCTSDLHIKHGFVPRAVPGITLGHEAVGIVRKVGSAVSKLRPGDRVAINVETFCGECFFCRHGYVNNCTLPEGGWAIGCRIDGVQAKYARIPQADNCLYPIPDSVDDLHALFVGDILSTGYWAAKIAEIPDGGSVVVTGAGPTGLCAAMCASLHRLSNLVICEKDDFRRGFAQKLLPDARVCSPRDLPSVCAALPNGGADSVIEAAGGEDTFSLAWRAARPNAVVVVVAMYDKPQILPLPDMYGKNLTFKTGGVDGCDCAEILKLIGKGRIDTSPLVTHTFALADIAEAYSLFESRKDNVIKVAVKP